MEEPMTIDATEVDIPDAEQPPELNPGITPPNHFGVSLLRARLAERIHMTCYIEMIADAAQEKWIEAFTPDVGAEAAVKCAKAMGESLKKIAAMFDAGEHVNDATARGLVWLDIQRAEQPELMRKFALMLEEAREGFPGYPG
jgi:hypothetical protein